MSAAEDFKKALQDLQQSARQAQIRWATVKAVDWQQRTMTAIGTMDNLEYYDVALGLGCVDIKPAVDSEVVIGILEGHEASAFLLSASTVELVEFNGGQNGGIVISAKVAEQLNNLERDINDLKRTIAAWVAVPQDGGASLKTTLAAWTGRELQETVQAAIENKKITH